MERHRNRKRGSSMELQKSIRRRTNVTSTTKGALTFDATVETENTTEEEHLRELDSLLAQMKLRAPLQSEEAKK